MKSHVFIPVSVACTLGVGFRKSLPGCVWGACPLRFLLGAQFQVYVQISNPGDALEAALHFSFQTRDQMMIPLLVEISLFIRFQCRPWSTAFLAGGKCQGAEGRVCSGARPSLTPQRHPANWGKALGPLSLSSIGHSAAHVPVISGNEWGPPSLPGGQSVCGAPGPIRPQCPEGHHYGPT